MTWLYSSRVTFSLFSLLNFIIFIQIRDTYLNSKQFCKLWVANLNFHAHTCVRCACVRLFFNCGTCNPISHVFGQKRPIFTHFGSIKARISDSYTNFAPKFSLIILKKCKICSKLTLILKRACANWIWAKYTRACDVTLRPSGTLLFSGFPMMIWQKNKYF